MGEQANSHLAMQATQTRKSGLEKWEFTPSFCISQPSTMCSKSVPPSAWHEEWYLSVKDTVQSTWGATPLPSLLLGTSHQPRALTPGSLLPPAPTLHPQVPASLPIESGDHSSWSKPPPSSPRVPSIMCGDCKHPETRLMHTCRIPCWDYNTLLLIVAQHRIRV